MNENNSGEQINQSQVYYTENKKEKNNNNVSERNTINSILNNNYKYNTAQKSTMANSIQASKQYLFPNEKEKNKILNDKKQTINKKKETENHIETINSIKENNDIKINNNQNIETINSKKEDKEEIESDSNTKKESSRELNFKTKNILSGDFDMGKDSDSISRLQQNESFNNNNKLSENNDDYDDNNPNLISPYQKDLIIKDI